MSTEKTKPVKPLGGPVYGSIPHLPGSNLSKKDKGATPGMARMCCEELPDRRHRVIIQEKLDGSCVAVARVDGELVALGRAGYPAITSPYEQHHLFHNWVQKHRKRFEFLGESDRVVGEWLAQAHGTKYPGITEPFVVFDYFPDYIKPERAPYNTLMSLVGQYLPTPRTLIVGPMPPECAADMLWVYIFGNMTGPFPSTPEGVIYRVEDFDTDKHRWRVKFLAKWVHPGQKVGQYLPEINPEVKEPVWNWRP